MRQARQVRLRTHPPRKNANRPEAASATEGEFPTAGGSFGLDEFVHHFAPHEPMYFVGGSKAPQIKFQLSIRYRILNPEGPLASQYQLLKGFNFAYSQTSLWDWSDPNMPFFYDTSYRPEFFYYLENLPKGTLPEGWQAGVQAGVGHESNGLRDPDHRSLNIVYVRPIFTVSDTNERFVPDAGAEVLRLHRRTQSESGHFKISRLLRHSNGGRPARRLATGGHWANRKQLGQGKRQMDLTYPLTKILQGNVDVLLDAQYFIGYGDTLLTYNKYTQVFRIGLALVR